MVVVLSIFVREDILALGCVSIKLTNLGIGPVGNSTNFDFFAPHTFDKKYRSHILEFNKLTTLKQDRSISCIFQFEFTQVWIQDFCKGGPSGILPTSRIWSHVGKENLGLKIGVGGGGARAPGPPPRSAPGTSILQDKNGNRHSFTQS